MPRAANHHHVSSRASSLSAHLRHGAVVISQQSQNENDPLPSSTHSSHSHYHSLWNEFEYHFCFTRSRYKHNNRRDERSAKLNAKQRARYDRRNPYKVSDHLTSILNTLSSCIFFFAFMHVLALAYMLLAYMISQHALVSIPFLFAPKRADKFTLLFIATLHYTMAIPFATTTILLLSYSIWQSSPTVRALPFWILGVTLASLIHVSFHIFSTLIDHFFSPITCAICYLGKFSCIIVSFSLAITTKAIRYTLALLMRLHAFLEHTSKYLLPNHQAHWYTTSSNHPPLPNTFASALSQYVRSLSSNQSSNSPHAQYFAQYMCPPPPDRLAFGNILPSLFSFVHASLHRLFSIALSFLLFQSRFLSYVLLHSSLFYACAQERFETYSSSRYRMRFISNLLRVLRAYIRPFTFKPLLLMCLILMASASNTDESHSRPPLFDGTRGTFIAWVIAFTGWVAWRLTDATGIADGTDTLHDILADEPDPVAEPLDHSHWSTRLEKWHTANRKLYGAILQAVPEWLRTSIFHDHRNNGISALEYLHRTFDANDANDNAAHVARLHVHHIDPKSDLSEDNLRLQYDSMMLARAGILRTGNTPPDDNTLIAMFDNSLPLAYAHIRQLVRRSNHSSFSDHYNDYMGQVRAELSSRRPAVNAFPTFPNPNGPNPNPRRPSGGRGNGYRGGPNPNPNPRTEPSSNPCLRCGLGGHSRRDCTKPKVVCRYCQADHRSSFCPNGPGSVYRDALGEGAKAILKRDAEGNSRPRSTPPNSSANHAFQANPNPHPGATNPPTDPTTQTIPPEAHAAAAAAASSQAEPLRAAEAYTAALRALGFGMMMSAMAAPPVPSSIRSPPNCTLVSALVDSMATFWVVPSASMLHRITNPNPGMSINTANGPVHVASIGIARVLIRANDDSWHQFNVPNVLVLPDCPAVLYSTRVMNTLFGLQHDTDKHLITLPASSSSGHRVPTIDILDDGSSYYIPIAFDTRPSPPPKPCLRCGVSGHTRPSCPRPALTCPFERPSTYAAAPTLVLPPYLAAFPSGVAGTPQATLYHRLGFPSEAQWRHAPSSLANHGLPPNAIPSTTIPVRDAVLRARSRLPRFESSFDPNNQPPPGAVFYMDFAGPLLKSFLHGFIYYCGVVDAGSGYGRLYPCHGPTATVASASLENFTSDIAAKMRLTYTFKPSVVRSDQGSAFISHHFREFLDVRQIQQSLACSYTPQQNSHVERFWGIIFSLARVLLCAANLPPSFHPFAVQHAAFLANRLPRPSRSNQSPFFLLSRSLPDISNLYCFGCLSAVTLPMAWRSQDHHFADRGEFALYLGPSEISPGHIVYLLSSRKLATRPKIRVWEDQFPGLKGHSFAWCPPDSDDLPSCPPTPAQEGPAVTSPSAPIPSFGSPPSQGATNPSPPQGATNPSPTQVATDSPPPQGATNVTPPQDATNPPFTPRDKLPSVSSPPSSQPPPSTTSPNAPSPLPRNLPATNDPSSRHFKRVVPTRRRATTANFIHDTHAQSSDSIRRRATTASALAVYTFLTIATKAPPSWPPVAFFTSVDPIDDAFLQYGSHETSILDTASLAAALPAIAITTDMGDISIPKGYRAATLSEHAAYWIDAIARELRGLIENDTWEVVPLVSVPPGSNIMRCHFVFTVKRNADGTVEKFKARLVADGNTQRYGVDFDRVFATVVKASTLRLLLLVAALFDYDLHQVDIRQAYIHAKLTTNLYMHPPPGAAAYDSQGRRLVYKLRRSLYGLKQAGREWAALLSNFLIGWGFTRSSIDTCLYLYSNGSTILWVAVYVDDALLLSNDASLRARFMSALTTRFPTDDKGELSWLLGISITRERKARTIHLSQELYVEDLIAKHASHITAGQSRTYDAPMEEGLILTTEDCPALGSTAHDEMSSRRPTYLSIVGGLLWLANMSRPDISYAAGQLSRFLTNPGVKAFNAAIRVLIYLHASKSRRLTFRPNASRPFVTLVDSSWTTKFSCSGAFFTLYGCPFHWFCKTQRSVTLSSAEAEYFGATLAAKEVLFFRALLHDLNLLKLNTPSMILCDSKSAVDMAYDPVAFKKTKHILRAAEFLRDTVAKLHARIAHLSGNYMVADMLTKSLSRPSFIEMLKFLDTLSNFDFLASHK